MKALVPFKPQDPGTGGGDGGVNLLAALLCLLACLAAVAPFVVIAWRAGNRTEALVTAAIPVVGIALWVLMVAITN